jgi:hypothetical protein
MDHLPTAELIFEEDLKNAIGLLNRPLRRYSDEKKSVTVLTDSPEIRMFLKSVYKNPPLLFAFDYETTGLKPHANGHHIVSCAISWGEKTFAFMMDDDRHISLLSKILKDKRSGKIAANMKFEEIWSRFRLNGTKVENWVWDTMVCGHVLDHRPGITSLKFQSYVRYGLADYDSHIEPFLKAPDSNSFNRIYELDKKDLLVYNGIDGLMEYRVAMDQMREMGILDQLSAFSNGFSFPRKTERDFEDKDQERRAKMIHRSKRRSVERI